MPLVGELEQREPNGVAKNRWLRLFNQNDCRGYFTSDRSSLDMTGGTQTTLFLVFREITGIVPWKISTKEIQCGGVIAHCCWKP